MSSGIERAILCEREFDGEYERVALRFDEFDELMKDDNQSIRSRDITNDWRMLAYGVSTLYCRTAYVGDDDWTKFFTDMQYGLPERAVATGEYSCVRVDLMGKLRGYLTEDGSRLLLAWCCAKSQGLPYEKCFTEDCKPTERLVLMSKLFRSFIDHQLGFSENRKNT